MIRPTILATTITAILVHNTVSANTTNQTLIQTQDARNQALLEQLVPNPSVVVDIAATDTTTQIQEQPAADNAICFDIHKMGYSVLSQDDLIFADKLGFALVPEIMGNSSVLGKCMTVTDINAIATRVQNRLIEQGYVTSRIMVGDQNLADGELALTLIPGKIAQVVVNTADSKVPVYTKQTNRAYPAILDTALTTQTGKL
ncbi:POTRA domain-containing protein, partial [Moraxella porci]|uniref:POTRA domain-containing protein n=1 Tax=Moraxella porci TaxID=1288392 RepID=UPI002446C3B2